MPPVHAFRGFGLFVEEGFLSADECRGLAGEMLLDAGEHATIFGESATGAIALDVRRAWEVEVPAATQSLIRERLRALRPALERHFGQRLGDAEAASFVRYPAGAFYRVHKDRRDTPDDSHAERRAVSVVIFVNGPDDGRGFAGGRLRFYGLLGEGALADVGIDAEPCGGTLLAFPSTLLHEVTAVEHGTRLTVVTWYPGGSEPRS